VKSGTNPLRYACLFLVVPFAAEAQSRPTPVQTADISEASASFCQSALLENSGPVATMSGNTKARLGKIVEQFSSMNIAASADLNGETATRSLQTAVTHILATSSFCEQDLADLLTRKLFPNAASTNTASRYTPSQDGGVAGHYLGTVTNVTRMTNGTIMLDISNDGTIMKIHLHTDIVTRNDADLQVTSASGPTIEASGPMHTSRGISYKCHFHMRRGSGSLQGSVLKGDFEIDPVWALGSAQAYQFEVRNSHDHSIP
jgi:hypothetical protein